MDLGGSCKPGIVLSNLSFFTVGMRIVSRYGSVLSESELDSTSGEVFCAGVFTVSTCSSGAGSDSLSAIDIVERVGSALIISPDVGFGLALGSAVAEVAGFESEEPSRVV